MTDLLTQLGWKLAPVEPPPPPPVPVRYSEDRRKWEQAVFAQLENLVWQIEEKHWKSSINIQRDVVDALPHIPPSFVRSVTDGITPEYAGIYRLIIRGS
jgi:hypothetical protein